MIMMAINYLPRVALYWSSDVFLGNEGIKKIMTRNRFFEISKYLHFNDSTSEPKRGEDDYDRLYKIRPVLDYLKTKFQESFSPGKKLSVDEAKVGYKGRLSFKQYMPAKPTKYGIKVWKAADSANGCALNYVVYLGKDNTLWRMVWVTMS